MNTSNDTRRVVLITGAAGQLGRAVVAHFEGQNARLALLDRSEAHLSETYGAPAVAERQLVACDLLQAEATRAAVQSVFDRFGRIDVLCNLAGGFRMGPPAHATPDADWDAMFALNLRTVLHTTQAVVPHMLTQGSGKIINIGAFAAALRGAPNMAAYVASKAAVIRLTESMAAELRGEGINVNCVLPTVIDTPLNRQDMPDADPSRWVAPADLAAVIGFLASDAGRAVHGAALPVTGLS